MLVISGGASVGDHDLVRPALEQLGAKLDFPEYYISRNVDSLVREGWAERRPDPNSRRSVRIFLTAKGRDMAAKLPAIIREANTEHLSSLTKDESAALMGLLQKVAGFGDPKGDT